MLCCRRVQQWIQNHKSNWKIFSRWPLLDFVSLKKRPTVSSGNTCLSITLSLGWTSGTSHALDSKAGRPVLEKDIDEILRRVSFGGNRSKTSCMVYFCLLISHVFFFFLSCVRAFVAVLLWFVCFLNPNYILSHDPTRVWCPSISTCGGFGSSSLLDAQVLQMFKHMLYIVLSVSDKACIFMYSLCCC